MEKFWHEFHIQKQEKIALRRTKHWREFSCAGKSGITLSTSGHVFMWAFFLVAIWGTPDQNLSSLFTYILTVKMWSLPSWRLKVMKSFGVLKIKWISMVSERVLSHHQSMMAEIRQHFIANSALIGVIFLLILQVINKSRQFF